jgi:hypothetical protein
LTAKVEYEVTNSTLTSHRRRVQKLEAVRAQKGQHVVLVFSGTPEADANADRLIDEGQKLAKLLDKELRVTRVCWSKV